MDQQDGTSFRKMQASLEREGYATLNLDYASRSKTLEALAEDIHPAIERFVGSVDGCLHFVCHRWATSRARLRRKIPAATSRAW